jgi:molybdopterin biosynthesis enzyme
MTSNWNAALESWGLPYYFSGGYSGADGDIGPLAIGRVYGTEWVNVADALNRVLATDVAAALPVPRRALAAVGGQAVNSQDTATATPGQPVQLGVPARMSHCLGAGPLEAPLASHASQGVQPFTMLLDGADAVLGPDSPHYAGTSITEKLAMNIIKPVAAGTGVVRSGADVVAGAPLLFAGRRVSAGDVAALCTAGVDVIEVYSRPRVAVCMLQKYFKGHSSQDATTLPDGVLPTVLAVLARWGVEVDTVKTLDFSGRLVDKTSAHELNAISGEHDLTITLGFLGDEHELNLLSNAKKLASLAEPVVNLDGNDASYSRHRSASRPGDVGSVQVGAQSGNDGSQATRCKMVVALQGLPLPIYVSMYTVVKPILDALCGVGAFPVQAMNEFGFGSAKVRNGLTPTAWRDLLRRPERGMSSRHGVRWFAGVLGAPAPRDVERHWLQLAQLTIDARGKVVLQVLPSMEHQVSGLIGADAIVAIEKGEGEAPAGIMVKYFLLE